MRRLRIAALGAGWMGTAMALHAKRRGHDVRLWGTWLDDPMLDPVERGEPHPKLGVALEGLPTLRAPALAAALEGAELVLFGVSSEGAWPVLERALPALGDVPIVAVTKGFLPDRDGTMRTVPVALASAAGRPLRWVHASGPAKAFELARGVLTWMHFAGADAPAAAEIFRGGGLHVTTTPDLEGACVCSALKNAYATGLGIFDGLVGKDAHNARAACFTQAVREMSRAALAVGGALETAIGPAGMGDLHVTAAAGRNRLFGERVGAGGTGADVAARMREEGTLTEGYPAIRAARRWAEEHGLVHELPLLETLHRVVWEDADARVAFDALKLDVV